jgi:hypothetical protein
VEPHVDRSITPLLQEAMDPNFFYQPNGYPSPAYYYPSGMSVCLGYFWTVARFINCGLAIFGCLESH